jgi:hypothetical protein
MAPAAAALYWFIAATNSFWAIIASHDGALALGFVEEK